MKLQYIKSNQNRITVSQNAINHNILELKYIVELIAFCNKDNKHNTNKNKSELFSDKNKVFSTLCKLQDILIMEKQLSVIYASQLRQEKADNIRLDLHKFILSLFEFKQKKNDRKQKEKQANKKTLKGLSKWGNIISYSTLLTNK